MVPACFPDDFLQFAVDGGGVRLESVVGATHGELGSSLAVHFQLDEVMRPEHDAQALDFTIGPRLQIQSADALLEMFVVLFHATLKKPIGDLSGFFHPLLDSVLCIDLLLWR